MRPRACPLLACVLLLASSANAEQIVVTNADRYSPAKPVFTRLNEFQWLAAGFTTGGSAVELDHIRPLLRLTTLSSQIVAELRAGGSGPGAPIQTFTPLFGDFVPDAPVTLAANTSYFFSLGYLEGIAIATDWFHTETDLTWDGPGALDAVYVSHDHGAGLAHRRQPLRPAAADRSGCGTGACQRGRRPRRTRQPRRAPAPPRRVELEAGAVSSRGPGDRAGGVAGVRRRPRC